MTRPIIVAFSVLTLLTATAVAEETVAVADSAVAVTPEVVVYYFHGEYRCETCLRLEAWSEAAVKQEFARELDAGWLAWRTVNIHDAENEHFADEFGLSSQSLVVVEVDAAKTKRSQNLEKIWDLTADEAAFAVYVKQSLREFLAEE